MLSFVVPLSTSAGAEMNLARYKYVVQVVIGEQRGEGVRMGSRCFWDSETDNVASETYINVRMPCLNEKQALNRRGSVRHYPAFPFSLCGRRQKPVNVE